MTSLVIDLASLPRQVALEAWCLIHGLNKARISRTLNVHPSMVTKIFSGERTPALRIEQLAAMGIPRELLDLPVQGKAA